MTVGCHDAAQVCAQRPAPQRLHAPGPRSVSSTGTTIQWTTEQQRFFQLALVEAKNVILEGEPGSGKTTAMAECISALLA